MIDCGPNDVAPRGHWINGASFLPRLLFVLPFYPPMVPLHSQPGGVVSLGQGRVTHPCRPQTTAQGGVRGSSAPRWSLPWMPSNTMAPDEAIPPNSHYILVIFYSDERNWLALHQLATGIS